MRESEDTGGMPLASSSSEFFKVLNFKGFCNKNISFLNKLTRLMTPDIGHQTLTKFRSQSHNLHLQIP